MESEPTMIEEWRRDRPRMPKPGVGGGGRGCSSRFCKNIDYSLFGIINFFPGSFGKVLWEK